MKVEIHEHLEDGARQRIATFFLRGGEIQCDNPVLWKHLMNSNGGVIIGSRGKRYYPRDGADYLRNLKYQFAGPYLYAGPVEDEDGDREDQAREERSGAREAESKDLSSMTTVKTRHRPGAGEPARGRAIGSRRKPAGRDRPALVGFRRFGGTDSASALTRDDLEAVCGGVFRSAVALRGLSYAVARAEMDGLLDTITRVAGVDRGDLVRAFESREAYLELRYQPPSRQNYEKLWIRAERFWWRFVEILEAGRLEDALWPLYMTWEAMRCLPEHRAAWLDDGAFQSSRTGAPAGTRHDEVLESWERHGVPAFRKRGLSRALLDETFAGAKAPFEAALAAFRDAAFRRGEAEVRGALAIDPGLVDARLVLGDILRRLDQPGAALVELQLAAELETLRGRGEKGRSPDPVSLLRLARTQICIGKTHLADGRLREATAQLDRSADTMERLVRIMAVPETGAELPRTVLEEKRALHGLLERIYRDLGDVERADHHRKRQSAS